MSKPEIPPHTHKATLSIFSSDDNSDVWIRLEWDPPMTGEDVTELGYMPAAYDFVQEYIVPALDAAYSKTLDGLMEAEAVSKTIN